jgi:hypothetical protein
VATERELQTRTPNETLKDRAEYGNDSNSDPGVKHSAAYELGYARGHAFGEVTTITRLNEKCGQELAELDVESRNPKIAGKYLAEGYFAPSQLKAAVDKFGAK